MPVTLFFCYAREDEALLVKLKRHLRPLQRQGLLAVWHDRDISPGASWEQEIHQHLSTAQIILLLVSPDFMDSDYCYGIEMKQALERHVRGETTVIPIILRPTYWKTSPLASLQVLPTDGKPITSALWHDQDTALYDVTEGIFHVVEQLMNAASSLPAVVEAAELQEGKQRQIQPKESTQLESDSEALKTSLEQGAFQPHEEISGNLEEKRPLLSLVPTDAEAMQPYGDNQRQEPTLLEKSAPLEHDIETFEATVEQREPTQHERASEAFKTSIEDRDSLPSKETTRRREENGQAPYPVDNAASVLSSPLPSANPSGPLPSASPPLPTTAPESASSANSVSLSISPPDLSITPSLYHHSIVPTGISHLPRQSLPLSHSNERIYSAEQPPLGKTGLVGQAPSLHTRRFSRRLVIGGGVGLLVTVSGGSIIWWTVTHSIENLPYTYRGHNYAVNAVAWSPDGKLIASGSYDGTVQVWNAVDGSSPYIYRGHTTTVNAVAWSPDGKRIASGSGDKTVQVWNAANGSSPYTYRGHTDSVYAVAWSPDGKRIASGSIDKTVQVWSS